MAEENSTVQEIEIDRLLTVEEMCEFLHVKIGTLKDWTKLEEDPCPCYRYKARILRFDKNEVLNWFRNRTKSWRD